MTREDEQQRSDLPNSNACFVAYSRLVCQMVDDQLELPVIYAQEAYF